MTNGNYQFINGKKSDFAQVVNYFRRFINRRGKGRASTYLCEMQWFIKYKLYHIPFWFAYHLVWCTVAMGDVGQVLKYLVSTEGLSIKFYFYIIFQAAAVYFNLYYLIPKYLHPGKYKAYIGLLVGTIIACASIIASGYYLTAYISGKPFFELFGLQPNQYLNIFFNKALPSTLGSMTLGMSVKLTKNWLGAEKKRHLLEKEKLETELQYLKSQINPHFLFNTINSIYVLIHKNPDLAAESLASFSDMLRHQLYECNDHEIKLSKELDFLENFIELERLRLFENQTELAFDINNQAVNDPDIAPFILLPFVENAFKHVSKGRSQHNYIKMDLTINQQRQLEMCIENSKGMMASNGSAGIGLRNASRRLSLLYPDKHRVNIQSDDSKFTATLSIDLA